MVVGGGTERSREEREGISMGFHKNESSTEVDVLPLPFLLERPFSKNSLGFEA